MTAGIPGGRKALVPRWRYIWRTPFTAEHQGDPLRAALVTDSPALEIAEENWRRERSFANALELTSCACAFGKPERGHEAAKFLRARRGRYTPALDGAIDWILSGARPRSEAVATPGRGPDAGRWEAREVIARARARLRASPRNALQWLDLALAFAVLNLSERAEWAMNIAVALAPDHRIVLRTRARMLIHFGRLDEAHVLIRRHPRTRSDPWLMSTEMALAHLLKRDSGFAAQAPRFALDYRSGPEHVTELAATAAIFEDDGGSHRRAHKLYGLALARPTDNVLAHIQYRAQEDRSLVVRPDQLALPHAMEARAWRAWMEGRWDDVLSGSSPGSSMNLSPVGRRSQVPA